MVEKVKDSVNDAEGKQRAHRRREHRRAAIVAAAEAELAVSGFDGLTLAAVGERVGLSKAALYYYVKDRDSLLALVLADALATIRSEAERTRGATPLDAIRGFARAHIRRTVESPSGKLIASSVLALSASTATRELLREHNDAFLALVDEAASAGALREVPATIVGPLFFGAMNAVATRFDPYGPIDIDTVVDITIDTLLRGWGTSSSSAAPEGGDQ